jgi:hypothetical protein
MLRQNGPGLPDKIIVSITPMKVLPGAAIPAGWSEKHEYIK